MLWACRRGAKPTRLPPLYDAKAAYNEAMTAAHAIAKPTSVHRTWERPNAGHPRSELGGGGSTYDRPSLFLTHHNVGYLLTACLSDIHRPVWIRHSVSPTTTCATC